MLVRDASRKTTFVSAEYAAELPYATIVPLRIRHGSCLMTLTLNRNFVIGFASFEEIGISMHILGLQCFTEQTPEYIAAKADAGVQDAIVMFMHGEYIGGGNQDEESHDLEFGWLNDTAIDLGGVGIAKDAVSDRSYA